jgi:hypothetical protein
VDSKAGAEVAPLVVKVRIFAADFRLAHVRDLPLPILTLQGATWRTFKSVETTKISAESPPVETITSQEK